MTPALSEVAIDSVLRDVGYQVFVATDGKRGLHMAMECRPHLIVADWLMPELDGLQFCRTLRSTTIGRGVYLLLLTGVEEEARLLDAFDAGVDDYIVKPVNPRVLLARLKAGERVVSLQTEVESDREEIRNFAAELALTNRRLQEAALLDALTGIPNRLYLTERFELEWTAALKSRRSLSCVMVDADHFKRVNDAYGHQAGDAVLRSLAQILRTAIETHHVAGRYGGEEFIVICPDTDIIDAAVVGEKLRSVIESTDIEAGTEKLRVTVSVGVATKRPEMTCFEDLIAAADRALYRAKSSGRNRVERDG